jgi:putative tryptophan/tyrosine transport system substrate-binding protein
MKRTSLPLLKRREFITLLGGSASAWPLAARAQQHRGPVRLAIIPIGSPSNPYDRSLVEAFQRGLRRVGLIENQDVALDIVWAGDGPDQAVSEALQRGAELLIPCGSGTSVAAKRQTSSIPIVFVNVGDPMAMGLVESLAHPGKNATGFSDILAELSGKLVDVARELIKPHRVIHYLWHTAWPDGQNRYQTTEQAVRSVGMQLQSRGIAEMSELDAAVAAIKMSGSPAFIVQPSPFTYGHRGAIIASAQKNGLGTIFAFPVAAREGALVAYGPDYVHMYSRAPLYVDRILKGAKPADLPVEGPSKVEFLVNLQAAKALWIEVPLPLLVRADDCSNKSGDVGCWH